MNLKCRRVVTWACAASVLYRMEHAYNMALMVIPILLSRFNN